MSDHCPAPKRPSLNYHLFAHAQVADDLRHLITDISRAIKYISYAIQTTEIGLAGTVNQFGEEQQKLDVLSDSLFHQYLCESRVVSSYVSEEQDAMVELDSHAPYSVVYDPLDGSSLIDANFSIGSIVGIYKKGDVVGRTPSEQVASFYALYGPRTLFVYAAQNGVHAFILNDVGEFILLEEHMGIGDTAKNYSPGNLRAVNDNPGYRSMINQWFDDELTLRYSGCMVADIHHILAKGQGVFTNVGGSAYPDGKLRHVMECGPLAHIAHQAGGAATDGTQNLLKKKITSIDQRTPIILGSKNEVQRVGAALLETS